MSINNDECYKQENLELTKKENKGCMVGIFGVIAFIIGMIIVLNGKEDGSTASKIAAFFVFAGIILFFGGITVFNKANRNKSEIFNELEKQRIESLKREYLNDKEKNNIPNNARVVKHKSGYMDIDRVTYYTWIDKDNLYFFPTEEMVKYYENKAMIHKIPLDKIEYYATRGEIVHENRITGGSGGGSSLKGAVVGGVIAGGAGAVIGSRKKTDPIKSELITHDRTEAFLNFFDDKNEKQSMFFDFKDYDTFNELMPEKAFEIVNTIKTNNILEKVANENKANTITEQIRELAKLRDEGILTEDEFNKKKEELLKRI